MYSHAMGSDILHMNESITSMVHFEFILSRDDSLASMSLLSSKHLSMPPTKYVEEHEMSR